MVTYFTWGERSDDINLNTVNLDLSVRQNKRQLDFKRQNENDRFSMY